MTISTPEEAATPVDPAMVVLPSIFDAHARPDILLPLVLANLLSPQLWALSAKARSRAATTVPAGEDLPPGLRAAQVQIDRHFEHLTPTRTAEIFGELDLDEESGRIGREFIDHALRDILRGVHRRVAEGTLDPAIEQSLLDRVARRRFPAYHYATFDVVRANRRLIQDRRRVPHGLTSCLDETAIFAALVLTLPEIDVTSVVCLASPEHYTAFGWNETSGPWWFYSKNRLLSATEWRHLVDTEFGGNAQTAFDRHLAINGTCDLSHGQSSIPADHLQEILAIMERYFGMRLRQIDDAFRQTLTYRPPSPFAPVFRELLADRSEPMTRRKLRKQADPELDRLMEIVLHTYRSLEVADLTPYLVAARRSPSCRQLAAGLASVTAALDAVRAIPGRESIVEDRERIAMPEETLRFRTGSDRDLALLLHVLIEAMPGAARTVEVATFFAADDSYVVGPGWGVSLRRMAFVDESEARESGGRILAAPRTDATSAASLAPHFESVRSDRS